MKKLLALIIIALALGSSCNTVPVTGRKQLSLISNAEIFPMSFQSYQQVIDTSKVVSTAQAGQVKTVGLKIQKAVEKYMAEKGLSNQLNGYKWEFNVIDENIVNAWCMPGGKVVFYTGILPICKNETGIAVVMGHEVAHAIANHGAERMSQGMVQQLGFSALSIAVSEKPAETQQLFGTAYGVATTVGGILPFSRLHESEADKMGLIFMAMAGYDPREAPEFWKRMKDSSSGGAPPEFLSTHPAHSTRINDLNAAIPEAMKYYKGGN